jgi:hypothetical protein
VHGLASRPRAQTTHTHAHAHAHLPKAFLASAAARCAASCAARCCARPPFHATCTSSAGAFFCLLLATCRVEHRQCVCVMRCELQRLAHTLMWRCDRDVTTHRCASCASMNLQMHTPQHTCAAYSSALMTAPVALSRYTVASPRPAARRLFFFGGGGGVSGSDVRACACASASACACACACRLRDGRVVHLMHFALHQQHTHVQRAAATTAHTTTLTAAPLPAHAALLPPPPAPCC